MDASDFDIGQGAASAAPNDLAQVVQMAKEQIALTEKIEQLEAETKALKLALHKLRTGTFPERMNQLQLDEIVHDGWEIKVKPMVAGSLPKEPAKRKTAIDWLEEHEGGDLIKTEITLAFNRGDREEAIELAKKIAKLTNKAAVELAESVHAQTLQAWARERLRNGESIEFEAIGLFSGQITEVKRKG